ncbi:MULTISPECIES: alkene reductase [unclassified Novosphingobium]|uniref:alkene reductase n=1 Tax=unclassified Novosphingobium TaxID=2644732 RepID=UPI00135AAD38
MTDLFTPMSLGALELPHRIVMAPLTRARAVDANVPTPLMVEYYRQRASAALIITEATQVSGQAQGYAWTPGVHTPAQIAGWRAVADAVHGEGGRIFLQMWHTGRVSHPSVQPDGAQPVGPSAVPIPGGKTFVAGDAGQGDWAETPLARALSAEEVRGIVEDFAQAARNAIAAGMDGVEIHGGNGYLIDQFINSNSNHREDQYGGSSENRARFLLEIADAVAEAVGAERVGVRLTPLGRFMGMGDVTPEATYGHIVDALNERNLAYLHLVEPEIIGVVKDDQVDPAWDVMILDLRRRFSGPVILAGGYEHATASKALADGRGDLIAFGRSFIANPDLPERFRQGAALNLPDQPSFFGGTEKGYTDYPALTG